MNRSGFRSSDSSRAKQPGYTSKPKRPEMPTPLPAEKPTVFAQFHPQPEPSRIHWQILATLFIYAFPLFIIAAVTGAFDWTGEYTASLAIQHAARFLAIIAALKFHGTLHRTLS